MDCSAGSSNTCTTISITSPCHLSAVDGYCARCTRICPADTRTVVSTSGSDVAAMDDDSAGLSRLTSCQAPSVATDTRTPLLLSIADLLIPSICHELSRVAILPIDCERVTVPHADTLFRSQSRTVAEYEPDVATRGDAVSHGKVILHDIPSACHRSRFAGDACIAVGGKGFAFQSAALIGLIIDLGFRVDYPEGCADASAITARAGNGQRVGTDFLNRAHISSVQFVAYGIVVVCHESGFHECHSRRNGDAGFRIGIEGVHTTDHGGVDIGRGFVIRNELFPRPVGLRCDRIGIFKNEYLACGKTGGLVRRCLNEIFRAIRPAEGNGRRSALCMVILIHATRPHAARCITTVIRSRVCGHLSTGNGDDATITTVSIFT